MKNTLKRGSTEARRASMRPFQNPIYPSLLIPLEITQPFRLLMRLSIAAARGARSVSKSFYIPFQRGLWIVSQFTFPGISCTNLRPSDLLVLSTKQAILGKMNNETVKFKIHIIPFVAYRWYLHQHPLTQPALDETTILQIGA